MPEGQGYPASKPGQIIIPGWHGPDKPNTEWWLEQITAGIKFRDSKLYKSRWPKWDKWYRNEFNRKRAPMPVNLFFMMVRTLIPRLYFRNPSVSIRPAKPGPEQLGLAMLHERLDNKLIQVMNMKKTMKKIAQSSFFRGNSFGKLGYGSEYAQLHPQLEVADRKSKKKPWAKVDYRMDIQEDRPWYLHVPTENHVLPAHVTDRMAAPWEAQIVYRNYQELQADARFDAKNIGPSHSMLGMDETPDLTELYEIHDRRTGTTFTMAPNKDGSHVIAKPETDLGQTTRGGPFYDLAFNEATDGYYGVPDAKILEPFQEEMNDLMATLMTHAKVTSRKIKATRTALDPQEAREMVDGPAGAVIWVNDMNEVEMMQVGGVPTELIVLFDRLMQIIQFTVGFSRNQFGEYRGGSESPSATEANIVRQASEIRVDERRDMMADMLTDVMTDTNVIIANRWGEGMIEQVVGPFGVPVWIEFSGQMLQNAEYELNVDPDSSVPETKEAREMKARLMLEQLLPLSQIPDAQTGLPLIDSQKLMRFFLHEMKGTAYDDLLYGVPNIYDENFVRALTGGDADLANPISPQELGDRIGNAPQAANQLAGVFKNRAQ